MAMISKTCALSHERLKEVLGYNPDNGEFRWKVSGCSHAGKQKVGEIAGSKSGEKYTRIGIDGRVYRAHRLAWFYMTGEWPTHGIDHANLNANDNRWSNLRPATQSQNAANTSLRPDNKLGLKGVYWCKHNKKYVASITKNGKKKSLGYYDCPAAAYFAYAIASKEAFGNFARAA